MHRYEPTWTVTGLLLAMGLVGCATDDGEAMDISALDGAAALHTETQCGPTDDSQPVESYDGTLGVPRAFVDAHQAPVGQLRRPSGFAFCTGTLIKRDLLLTAGHCFNAPPGQTREQVALATTVAFNVQD